MCFWKWGVGCSTGGRFDVTYCTELGYLRLVHLKLSCFNKKKTIELWEMENLTDLSYLTAISWIMDSLSH